MAEEKKLGVLVIIAMEAKNLSIIGKGDPFVSFHIDDESKRIKADKRGGQHPKWDEEVRFALKNNTSKEMKIQVFNEDKREHILIGDAIIDLSGVLEKTEWDEWHEIRFRNKYAGEVFLEMTFYYPEPPVRTSSGYPPSGYSPGYPPPPPSQGYRPIYPPDSLTFPLPVPNSSFSELQNRGYPPPAGYPLPNIYPPPGHSQGYPPPPPSQGYPPPPPSQGYPPPPPSQGYRPLGSLTFPLPVPNSSFSEPQNRGYPPSAGYPIYPSNIPY